MHQVVMVIVAKSTAVAKIWQPWWQLWNGRIIIVPCKVKEQRGIYLHHECIRMAPATFFSLPPLQSKGIWLSF